MNAADTLGARYHKLVLIDTNQYFVDVRISYEYVTHTFHIRCVKGTLVLALKQMLSLQISTRCQRFPAFFYYFLKRCHKLAKTL